jgi:hypothetical protein
MTDEQLLDGFRRAAVAPADWTHRAHIRIAWLHLTRLPFDEALGAVRAGIKALNAANAVEDGPTSGYHETVTVAWLRIVASTIRHHPRGDTSDAFCDGNPHLLSRTVLRLFYSKEQILSPQAKAKFVEPDLTALPA